MSRKSDRKHALCMVFHRDFNKDESTEDTLAYYLENFAEEGVSEMDFILQEIDGVFNNLNEIDQKIDETSSTWGISRISKVDLAIMRLAVYEILYADDIGDSVSINEAVELAKTFSGEESGKFVNGILGQIVRKIRQEVGAEAEELPSETSAVAVEP